MDYRNKNQANTNEMPFMQNNTRSSRPNNRGTTTAHDIPFSIGAYIYSPILQRITRPRYEFPNLNRYKNPLSEEGIPPMIKQHYNLIHNFISLKKTGNYIPKNGTWTTNKIIIKYRLCIANLTGSFFSYLITGINKISFENPFTVIVGTIYTAFHLQYKTGNGLNRYSPSNKLN